MCRKTFWYCGIVGFHFLDITSTLSQRLVDEMLRDRPKSFEHRQVHIFVFQPADRQLTSQADLSNVWGQSRTPRQIAKSYQGESHCKIPVVFLIISKARNLANNDKPTRN